MRNGHVESQDHIEVVKCICLHSGELFKSQATAVQRPGNRKTYNPVNF